ncbi:hypothetical protein GN958_ATG07734, partial [Phytophthora infestans]
EMPPFPRVLEAILTIRVGEPLGTRRGGWKKEIMLDVQDGYAVFREKCLAKLTALVESGEAGGLGHLSEAGNPPPKQADYTKPDAGNFALSLVRRRRLLTPADKTNIGAFWFEAFLYVNSMAPPPPNFHRATQGRVEQARLQRIAHEATNVMTILPSGPRQTIRQHRHLSLTGNVLHSMPTSLLETSSETGERLRC